VQELNARAAGESLVRQALSELEQWELETRWSLSQHVDSAGAQLCLIKEYKELLNKVSSNFNYQVTRSLRLMCCRSEKT
jgi:dynein heavy chain 2, cytosolic